MAKKKDLGPAPKIVHPKRGGVYVRHEDNTLELEHEHLKRTAAEPVEEVAEEAEAPVVHSRRGKRGRR
jgi:hypothetical protein